MDMGMPAARFSRASAATMAALSVHIFGEGIKAGSFCRSANCRKRRPETLVPGDPAAEDEGLRPELVHGPGEVIDERPGHRLLEAGQEIGEAADALS